jgi:type I restriction enzyme, S subunit
MRLSSKLFYNLKNIPKNWKETKLKYILSFSEIKSPNFAEETILSLTKHGIIERNIQNNEGQIAESYEKYNLVEIGDICMNPMDLLSGWVDISKYKGLISPAYFTLKVNPTCDAEFVNFLLQSNYYRKTFFRFGKGVASHENSGRWVLTPEEFKNFSIFIPNSIEEQKNISSTINKKINEAKQSIDLLNEKLELLKEYKKSLISSIVP